MDETKELFASFSTGDVIAQIEHVRLCITARPIEDIVQSMRLDALISSDDALLKMDGGAAAAIAALAGPTVRQELLRVSPQPIGSLVVTSAGALSCRYILHAVTVDSRQLLLPTERTIRQLSREIFVRCEALGVRQVAMAAMGTGAGGFPGQHVARIIFEALLEHAQNPGELREVVLSLPNASIKKAFVDELVALRAEGRLRLSDDTRSLDNLILGVNDHQSKHSSRPILADRYVLLEEIGRGGFAIVHLAWDLVLRKVVAIKVLRPDRVFEAEYVSSMKREAAVLMDLSHESILRLYHFEPCERDGEAFLVMEYVPWPSGEKWIADAGAFGLPVSAIIDVGILLCHALHYAHERGVLHLDVKPRNVFVDSSAERAKIADFGLARVLSTGSTKALACWPQGTPAYMAPEQKVPGARLGIQTDVYLVAATLWDFTTGSPPHGNQPTQAPKPDRIGLMNVLRNALRPEPFARPRDCLALAADLAGLRST